MTMQRFGGVAALICAATYIYGFFVLVTILAPMGFGTNAIDAVEVVRFVQSDTSTLIAFNTTIYIVNALALAVLVTALQAQLRSKTPDLVKVSLVLGTVWVTLVLAAGMIANVAVERALHLAANDFDQAVALWQVLHAVELGLGGGNEIAGAAWIGFVSVAGFLGRNLGRIAVGLGVVTGVSGLLTLIPALGDVAGAVFGLGAIGWFFAIGWVLLRNQDEVKP
ncbi:hypothetical protein [Pontivivens insulae]|uniref:DUF4386 domain-containing protein n=1 Tax=Pontivivens insulae TaxID=1639689 RepID=A0A2R8AFW8_9RHOB|nr:hypothetical protein [Pontivivens insulae]RED10679.1 hypothetical protein DFR53_3497 [Pontivivens insulae]SPF31109.1 hypothetical protein POI8812_03460 [Pontivivens insulae]